MSENGIGASVRRKEDRRFITGKGRYTDDINRPQQVYAWIVRSPVPHARILTMDSKAAEAVRGVIAVFTGSDMAADGIGGLPCGWGITQKDGSQMAEPMHSPLAQEFVRCIGDQVAVVLAVSRGIARDAAELIEIEYEELPAVTDLAAANRSDAPQVWPEAPGNVCFDWEIGDAAAVEKAFAGAAHVVELDIVNTRLIPNAIEPRSAIGDYDSGKDEYTLYTSSQNPHVIRLLMGGYVLHVPEHKL